MRIKQGVAAFLIAGAIGLTTVGIGTGQANAATAESDSGSVHVVDWRGHGHGGGNWHDRGPGYYPDYRPWGGWYPWGDSGRHRW